MSDNMEEYALALRHVKYTIPPAIFLTLLFRPLQTRLDTFRIVILLTIAVLSTALWDSYLIRNHMWGYPSTAVLRPLFFGIPIEEVFFFFIQTYTTSIFYLLCNKATAHTAYLTEIHGQASRARVKKLQIIGALVAATLLYTVVTAIGMVKAQGKGMYMGVLLSWTGSLMLGLWCTAYRHILSLPLKNVLIPIATPSAYLLIVGTFEPKRGTKVTLPETKLGLEPWKHMEIEEFVFFIGTNVLIVFGQIAFDYGLALVTAFPTLFPDFGSGMSTGALMKSGFRAFFTWDFPADEYRSIPASIQILKKKSRSFYLASAVFDGRLRLDLIALYSFCRAADDLIDDSPTPDRSLERLQLLLDIAYDPGRKIELESFVKAMFPEWSHAALLALPSHKIPREPFDELLEGFRMDTAFPTLGKYSDDKKPQSWQIQTEADLQTYSHRVAGTVGEMFLYLVFIHSSSSSSFSHDSAISYFLAQGQKMGIALQYVNIARDIYKDAAIGRVYIPATWLREAGITEEAVISTPMLGEQFRPRLLEAAGEMYEQSRGAIELLPEGVRAGVRVAVENYMDIGRLLGRSAGEQRFRESKIVRIWRAWNVMRR